MSVKEIADVEARMRARDENIELRERMTSMQPGRHVLLLP